jgi:hypothetical protein
VPNPLHSHPTKVQEEEREMAKAKGSRVAKAKARRTVTQIEVQALGVQAIQAEGTVRDKGQHVEYEIAVPPYAWCLTCKVEIDPGLTVWCFQ